MQIDLKQEAESKTERDVAVNEALIGSRGSTPMVDFPTVRSSHRRAPPGSLTTSGWSRDFRRHVVL